MAAPAISSPASAYTAGSAVAGKVSWDQATKSKKYNCAFAGWAHVTVNWECKLKVLGGTNYVQSHSGSFSGGYKTTSTYYYRSGVNTVYCAVAYAAYADGSASASDETCG